MTPALIREAADRLELALRKFWSVDVVPPRPPFCSGCSTDYPNHKPDCLITRLHSAVDQMEKGVIEAKAQLLFEGQSKSWTGHVWDWEIASDEVKERFRAHARNDTRPWSKEDDLAAVRKTEQEG